MSQFFFRWSKYWSLSFSISPSNDYSGLISSRMDWLDLLAVQGILKSLLQQQFKSINSSALSFIILQLSHPYMTIGKTVALTRRTFVGKIISLLFNMLSRLVIDFLPRSKCLLISWLKSLSSVILEPKKVKSVTVSPSICHELMGPNAMIFVFWILSFKPTFKASFRKGRGTRDQIANIHWIMEKARKFQKSMNCLASLPLPLVGCLCMSHWLRALLPPGQPLCLPSRCHLLSQVSPEKTLFSPKTQGPRMDLPQTLGRFLLGCDSELLATCAGWTPQRWCPGRRGLPSPWGSGQGVLSLLLLGILWPRRMGCPTCCITCTATPSC